jgi:hypothetical protein
LELPSKQEDRETSQMSSVRVCLLDERRRSSEGRFLTSHATAVTALHTRVELFRSKFRYPKASAARSWHLPINQEIPRTPALPSSIIATHHVTTKQYRSCHNYSAARVVYDVCTLPSEHQTPYYRTVTSPPLRTQKDWRIKLIWERDYL